MPDPPDPTNPSDPRGKSRLRDVFRKYVAPEVIEQILHEGPTTPPAIEGTVAVIRMSPEHLLHDFTPKMQKERTAAEEIIRGYGGSPQGEFLDGRLFLFPGPAETVARAVAAVVELAGLSTWVSLRAGLCHGLLRFTLWGPTERLHSHVYGQALRRAMLLAGEAEPGSQLLDAATTPPGATPAGAFRQAGKCGESYLVRW